MDNNFNVVGYFPCWKVKKESKIRYDVFTHIIYAFAFPDDGTCKLVLPNADDAKKLVEKAHMSNVQVLLSIGGWDDYGSSYKAAMINAISDDDKINKFVNDIVLIVNELEFDGADICFSGLTEEDNISNVAKFFNKLSDELKMNEKILTATSFGKKENDECKCLESIYNNEEIFEKIDWINVIHYEVRDGVRASNINMKIVCDSEKSRPINLQKASIGLPFFVNISLMAYENDLKNTVGEINNSKEIVSCGRELYYSGDNSIESQAIWTRLNAKGINIWEVTQDFSEEENSYLTKVKNILNRTAFYK